MESPNTSFQAIELDPTCLGKLISTGLGLVLVMKTWSLDVFLLHFAFHLYFVHSEARIPSPARLFKKFSAARTNGRLDFSLSWQATEDPRKRPYRI